MTGSRIDPAERVKLTFKKLTEAVGRIDQVSGELAQQVVTVERALQSLNVGIACWVTLQERIEDGYCNKSALGYTRLNKHWRLVVRLSHGVEDCPADEVERWPINEAPRYLRAKAIDHIPELLDSLVKATDAATTRLGKQLVPATQLAEALQESLPSGKRKGAGR